MNLSDTLQLLSNDFSAFSSTDINAAFDAEIAAYHREPPLPCNAQAAKKMLAKFSRKSFREFWEEPISVYLPAVREGTMKLSLPVLSHQEALTVAHELMKSLSEADLARAFLYGTAHNAPEYRTALACWHFIRNLPSHDFTPAFLGTAFGNDRYSNSICSICDHSSKPINENKCAFFFANHRMAAFYLTGHLGHHLSLNVAIETLCEFRNLPTPQASSADLAYFMDIMRFIEQLPASTTSSKLKKELKRSGLLSMTLEQIENFIDLLGYLNILHPADAFGVTVRHINYRDMRDPTTRYNNRAYPVNLWKGSDGIDYDSIHILFDHLFEP